MASFQVAHAAAADWAEATDKCLERFAPPSRGLGFLYVTDPLADDLELILGRLKSATQIEHWIGTVGLGVCASGREYFDEPAMAVMLADMNPQSFRIFEPIIDDLDELMVKPIGPRHWPAGTIDLLGHQF